MNPLAPYLFFDGNCREAMGFYKGVFGGELDVMTYAEGPKESCPQGAENRVMHAALRQGDFLLMASDAPDRPPAFGDNIQVSVDCTSADELETLFGAMSKGGRVKMPVSDTFWGARFGMLVDRFGIHWMFSFNKSKKS